MRRSQLCGASLKVHSQRAADHRPSSETTWLRECTCTLAIWIYVDRVTAREYNGEAAGLRELLVSQVRDEDDQRDEHEEGAVAHGREVAKHGVSSRLFGSWLRAASRNNGCSEADTYWLLKLVLFSLVTAPLVVLIFCFC